MKALYNLGKLGFITGLIVGTVYFPTLSYGQSVAEQRICQQKGNYAAFARQPILGGQSGQSGSPADNLNVQRAHEQIFFCSNGRIVDNIGFGVGKSDIAGVPISGTGVRFSYSPREISSGRAGDGSRIDAFVPIDNERYNAEIIREIVGILPDRCELQEDGRYVGVGNNCQNFTDKVRKEYWKRMFAGTWIGDGYSCEQGGLTEKVQISVNGNSLIARKLTGDNCVPAGNVTFQGTIPSSVSKGSSFSVTFTVGRPNNPASDRVSKKLTILDANSFSSFGVRFTREE